MKKKKYPILWSLLLMSLSPASQGANTKNLWEPYNGNLPPVSQAAKEECDPSFFRQKKEEVLRLLRENPRITKKELAENINEPISIVNKILSEIREEKVLNLLREREGITIIELIAIIRMSEGAIYKIIQKLTAEQRIERIGRNSKEGFYRVLEEGETPSAIISQEEHRKQREEENKWIKEQILGLIREYEGRITIQEMAENIKVPKTRINRMIAELKDEERIKRIKGASPYGFYLIL